VRRKRHIIYSYMVNNDWTCNEDWGVVGCKAVSLRTWFTTFRMVVVPSWTGSNIPRRAQPFFDCLILEMKALLSFEPSDATLLTTQIYIPEYLSLEQQLKECHPRCVYQNYNGLIINNGSQKHNYIYKYNNSPTTCFGLIRPSSGWKYSVRGKIICLI